MKIKKEQFFVSVVDESLRDEFFNLEINVNLELPQFCLPDILDGDWLDYVGKIKSKLALKGLTCGVHGPFYNLAYHSRDPMVRGVAYHRMRQGLKIASELHSKFIVFHSTYNPFVAVKDYNMRWPCDAMRGLPEILKEAKDRDLLVVIENIMDDGPAALKGLLDKINSDSLKVCIDVGHLNIFSKVPLGVWLETLSEDIAHFHLHNNFGITDDHNGLRGGTFDFEKFFDLVSFHKIHSTYTLEVAKLESVAPSVQYLKELGVIENVTEFHKELLK